MECVICFKYLNANKFETLQCNHKLCKRCLHKQLHFDARCPMCRTIISSMENVVAVKNEKKINLKYEKEIGIKIVIVDETNKILITSCTKNAKQYGFETGQHILYINNVPCYNAKCVLQILDELKRKKVTVTFHVQLTSQASKSCLLKCMSSLG